MCCALPSMPMAATCANCSCCSTGETEDKNQVFTLFEDAKTRPYLAQAAWSAKACRHTAAVSADPGPYRLAGGAAQLEVRLVWSDPPRRARRKNLYFQAWAAIRSRSEPASSTAAASPSN